MEWLQVIVQIAASLVAMIPLVLQLVKYVKEAAKEKNWSKMVDLALALMSEAEEKFTSGADKKEWVMGMVKQSAIKINFDLDEQTLSDLIDNVITITKMINKDKPVEVE